MLRWLKGLSLTGKIVAALVSVGLIGAVASASPKPANTSGTKLTNTPQVQSEAKKPVITTKSITETAMVPFTSSTVNDASLASGKTKVKTAGVNGVKTSTYEVTYTDGKQTDKKLIKEDVTTQPVAEVTAIGTMIAYAAPKTTSNCDPNYSGACVPIASDVDCAGGSGNGPAYVQGPVKVIGTDIYHLDADGDGYGCN